MNIFFVYFFISAGFISIVFYIILKVNEFQRDYHDLIAYVSRYRYLAYSLDTISTFVDTSIIDPNDSGDAVNDKWRCVYVPTRGIWEAASAAGYLSTRITEHTNVYSEKEACTSFLFDTITSGRFSNFTIIDPCIVSSSVQCTELQSLIDI